MHVVRSVLEYFNECMRGSSVYLPALDTTKAYDRLNHCAVLLKINQIEVPVDIIMVFWYCCQDMFVVLICCGAISNHFDVKSDVRQRGVA